MLLQLGIVLCIVGYGSAATTTANPAVVQFKAIVNQEVAALWKSVDHDNSSRLDEKDLDNIIYAFDNNHDHQLSQSEFVSHFTNNSANLDIIAEGLFFELDMDDDNMITGSDMQRYYDKIDKNHDGNVTEAEFTDFFREALTVLFVLQYEKDLTTTTPSS